MISLPTSGSPMPVSSDRLVDLDQADRGAEDAEHAALGAAGDHARRRGSGVRQR